MDVTDVSKIGQVEGSNDIGADGFRLVCLTPINVGTSSDTSSVQNMSRLDFIQFCGDCLAIFQSRIGTKDLHALCG
jgi:hypothetical protein